MSVHKSRQDSASVAALGSPEAEMDGGVVADEQRKPKRRSRNPNGTPHSRFELRIPDDVLADAKVRAEREGVTLSSVIVEWLREYGQD